MEAGFSMKISSVKMRKKSQCFKAGPVLTLKQSAKWVDFRACVAHQHAITCAFLRTCSTIAWMILNFWCHRGLMRRALGATCREVSAAAVLLQLDGAESALWKQCHGTNEDPQTPVKCSWSPSTSEDFGRQLLLLIALWLVCRPVVLPVGGTKLLAVTTLCLGV